MKLASFGIRSSGAVCFGADWPLPGPPSLIDLANAWSLYAEENSGRRPSRDELQRELPSDAIRFIEGGAEQLARARCALRHCVKRAADAAGHRTLVERGVLYPVSEVGFLPPVPRPGKVISLGVNYPTHLAEAAGLPSVQRLKSGPGLPRAFSKLPSVLIGHREPVVYPRMTKQLDYEIELALIIGKRCKNVPRSTAADVIYGYTIFNDISMRDVQQDEMAIGLLLLGKNFDTSGPIGPWLVTTDEVANPNALDLTLSVNGEVRQRDNTRNMLRTVPEIIEYWSQITLEAGDVISTGTPAGVGFFSNPPEKFLLRPGDRIEATITRLGTLENTVVPERD
jgi:acylpyruvate hydrolase